MEHRYAASVDGGTSLSPTLAIADDPDVAASLTEIVVQRYYACFNSRRFKEAAMLFADDALIEQIPLGQKSVGADGYWRFAQAWTTAFPNGTLTVEHIERRHDTMCDVHLLSTGTHLGTLDIGVYLFRPTGTEATLRLRELLDIRNGKIVSSTLSFDLNDLVAQLTFVDFAELATRLVWIRQLGEELARARGAEQKRAVAERLGPELDAARRAVRPHYNR